jgi:hypothetical protein
MGKNAASAKSFTSAIEELPKIAESGTSAVSDMNDVLDESRQVLDDTGSAAEDTASRLQEVAPPMQVVGDHAKSMNEKLAQVQQTLSDSSEVLPQYTQQVQDLMNAISAPGASDSTEAYTKMFESVAGESFLSTPLGNIEAFQTALASPDTFQVINDHLDQTGQTYDQFATSLGDRNGQLLHEMSTDWAQTNTVMGNAGESFQTLGENAGKGFNAVAVSAQGADQAVSDFLGKPDLANMYSFEGINKLGGIEGALSGPLEELKSLQSVGIGEAFGNASEGIMGALNDIAMPLMAVQMIGMAVQQVGQSIYDAASIAEGPAAHSFGSFTGTVDALGQSAAKTGEQFSEGFGQGMLPALNEMNYEMNQGQKSAGPFGQSLGLAASTLASLWQIGTGQDVGGGLEGLANVGAQVIGVQQPFQGPGPAQQAQVNYQKSLANMPQTVQGQAYQVQTQADQYLQMASDPSYLASQDQLMASQQAYQHAQATYNSRHYISPQQALMNYQEQQYDTQQDALYNQQSQQSAPYDPIGYWGSFFGGLGHGSSSAIGSLFGGGGSGPQTSAFDQFMNSRISIPLPGLGGISDLFGNLFSGGGVPATTSMGCFPTGTRVLMADGSGRAIETLQIGEKVQSHDGATAILALIKPPQKPVYTLKFSDGNKLTLTDSHPIASLQGWKALSVEHAKQENPDLDVTTLEIGDSVHTIDGTCELTAIHPPQGVVQVYNITVGEPHTFYANNILVHNKMGSMSNSGEGSENVSISHTFTATVNWAATGLEKQFTAAAQWAEQNLVHTAIAAAQWAEQNLLHTATAAAQWAEQNLTHEATAAAEWAEQNLIHPAIAAAQWAEQGLIHDATAVATWAEQGLEHLFTGKAAWIGQDLEHMFTAVAQWTAQNLNPSFTVNPSVTMLAEGTSNFAGGPAIVGEAGPEVVSHNGQYSLFNQGATLLDLPAGASVYPMKNLSSSSVAQFADGTGDGPIIPLTFGASGGSNAPHSINVFVQLDSQSILSAIGMPMAQNIRLASGLRGF